jgi:hypothetical protein
MRSISRSSFPQTAWERMCGTILRHLLCLLILGLSDRSADAENVDLSTVPSRSTVQLTIYNSEDITLVRETRAVTFKRGSTRSSSRGRTR